MKTKIVTLLICIPLLLQAQTPEKNLEKYWYYRGRFLDKFIVVPDDVADVRTIGTGFSIPAFKMYTNSNNEKILEWGDSEQYLGWYIGVLATEFELLRDYGQTSAMLETEEELAKALLAIQRLDYYAESFYRDCSSDNYEYNDLNGFFIRDDVPSSILNYFPEPNKVASGFISKVENSCPQTGEVEEGLEMSQDMVWHMLIGLALVKKLNTTTGRYFPGIRDYNDRKTTVELAEDMAYRFVRAMQIEIDVDGSTILGWLGEILGIEINNLPGWQINNPVTGQCGKGRGMKMADVIGLSGGHLKMGELISGRDLHRGDEPIIFLDYLFTKPWNDHVILAYDAILQTGNCSSFSECIDWLQRAGQMWSKTPFAFEHVMLLYNIFNPPSRGIGIRYPSYYDYFNFISFVDMLLNTAPADGPHLYDCHNPSPNRHWASLDRLAKPHGTDILRILDGCGEEPDEMTGLDYMLLHNLYWINYIRYFDDYIPIPRDFPFDYTFVESEQVLDGQVIFPVGGGAPLQMCEDWVSLDCLKELVNPESLNEFYTTNIGRRDNAGSHSAPLTFDAYDEIVSSKVIGSEGDITFRAEKVTLTPGFKAEKGCSFTAGSNKIRRMAYRKLDVYDKSTQQSGYKSSMENESGPAIPESDITVKVYPNPADAFIVLSLTEDTEKICNVTITDAIGEEVMNVSNIDNAYVQLDINHLPAGFYILNIITDQQMLTKNIVKK